MYSGQPGVMSQPYGQGYPPAQPPMGAPGMGYQQPYPPQVPQQPSQPQFPDPMNLQQPKHHFYRPEMGPAVPQPNYLKNIGVALVIYVLFGIFCGLGLLISALVVDKGQTGYASYIALTTICVTPFIAFIIGMSQGKAAQSETEAVFTGIISNLIGFLIILFLIAGFVSGAISIKESGNFEVWDFIKQLIGVAIPCAVLGGFAAFFSERQMIS